MKIMKNYLLLLSIPITFGVGYFSSQLQSNNSQVQSTVSAAAKDLPKWKEDSGSAFGNKMYRYDDPKTGVEYLVTASYQNGVSMTPRLNKNGSVITH